MAKLTIRQRDQAQSALALVHDWMRCVETEDLPDLGAWLTDMKAAEWHLRELLYPGEHTVGD